MALSPPLTFFVKVSGIGGWVGCIITCPTLSMTDCSDCDQPDQVRGSGQRGLAVRHPGREQQPGDDLSPQEEKSGEERRWETAVESCMIVNHSYQCQVARQ